MKNVVFFSGSLQMGGTEAKLARNILPFFTKSKKVNPKLLLLHKAGDLLPVVPDSIEMLSLEENIHTNLLHIIPRFRDALIKLKADIVISFTWYPAVISYLVRKLGLARFKHIVHDTVNMTEYIKDHFAYEKYRGLKTYLTKKAYCDADVVEVVSQGEKDDLIRNFKIPEKKIIVIYNPLDKVRIADLSAKDTGIHFEMPLVVSVGRLVHQKGFDILLRAFRKVRDVKAAKLLLVGDGEKREELTSLAQSLHLQNDVLFLGMQENPFQFIGRAEVFCLASRYEGFGNVILEAMSLGVPVIVTDCPSGPSEIVEKGKYGILVPTENADAIAEALIRVLSDNQLRAGLSELSLKRAKDFDLEPSLKQWEDLILNL
jgi:glycosyltransferase involved in cell wall biosynthesis